jgi:signal transduction histidine kinase
MSKFTGGPRRLGTKLVLLVGFGGVLGLMALAGIDSITALHQIEAQNTEITRNYLQRHHLLEQIRSGLYLSSTYVRDYVMEYDPVAARSSLAGLRRLRDETDAALKLYGGALRPDERSLFSTLETEVGDYWRALAPVFHWGPNERRIRGMLFLETQVLPQRAATLGIANKIDAVNEEALTNGDRLSAGLFNRFRRRVLLILGLTLGIGAILAAITIYRILHLEAEARNRYEEIQRAQGELKQLSARLVQAQEAERRAIARELHDEVGQSLNALLVDLGNLAAIIPPGQEGAADLLVTAKRLVESSIKSLRDMALLLRPSMLDDFGLVPALHWQAREVARRTGMWVDVEAEEVSDELPEEHRTCIYRVAQEALHNASRHAQASRVRITVHQEPDRILLSVADDGVGFDPSRSRGLGLLGMEERVKHLNGFFWVQSRPGQGAVLTVQLPMAAPGVQQAELESRT